MLVVALVAGTAWLVNAPAVQRRAPATSRRCSENPPDVLRRGIRARCVVRRRRLRRHRSCRRRASRASTAPSTRSASCSSPTPDRCRARSARTTPTPRGSRSSATATRTSCCRRSSAWPTRTAGSSSPGSRAPAPGTRRRSRRPARSARRAPSGATACQSAIDDADLDAVFTAAIATTPYSSAGYDSAHDAAVAGYREAWSEVHRSRRPRHHGGRQPGLGDRPEQVPAHPRRVGVRRRRAPTCSWQTIRCGMRHPVSTRVTLLDFTDVFCGEETCAPVVGGANIYRDQDHLTVTFADTPRALVHRGDRGGARGNRVGS